jgi:hypothetical protein
VYKLNSLANSKKNIRRLCSTHGPSHVCSKLYRLTGISLALVSVFNLGQNLNLVASVSCWTQNISVHVELVVDD